MNQDRRPANGEPVADTSLPVDEAPGGEPAPAAGGTREEGAPGGPASSAGTGAGPESGGEPAPEYGGEPREPGEPPGEARAAAETLRARLDEALGELERERDASLRARAEAENARRRAERDVEQAHRFGIEGLVKELLPVRDGLELGIRAAGEEGSTVEALAEGTEMTLRMLNAALEKFGAVEVDPDGEDFDPRFHEAMTMQEAEGVEPGKVLQVFQKGCLLHGRVVRPAKVIVSR